MTLRLVLMLILGVSVQIKAGPEADRNALIKFFEQKFPTVEIAAHKDGSYALDEAKREQWMEIEEFPPYEIAVDEGEILFSVSFLNGKSYADCFANGGLGIKQNYPYFDVDSSEVITLELAINRCRENNGEVALAYLGEEMGYISAYMAFTSRGNKIQIEVPAEGLAAYEQGKRFYYERRGQLNFACSGCHLDLAGGQLRAEILSASIGHTTHWPVYRFKWEQVGGLHKRFIECNENIGAVAFASQDRTYRNLEYFLTYMNNGMELNGPASRK